MSVISDTEKNHIDSTRESTEKSDSQQLDSPQSSSQPSAVRVSPAAEPPTLSVATSEAPLTLAIDIGGTGIKCMVLDEKGKPVGERQRQPTPRPATPQAVLATIKSMLPEAKFARVSVGFPGVVVAGVTQTAPNLHKKWVGYKLEHALFELTGRPTRVLNDAGVQGLGVVSGQGVEIVLTLGTGMGFALYVDGHYVPNIELAHHPLRRDMTYEQYVGNAARLKIGNRKWSRRVLRVLTQIRATFNPRVTYIGGGNSTKLKEELPVDTKLGDNIAGLLGGIALWR
jgi:polyphosphate glucokinase